MKKRIIKAGIMVLCSLAIAGLVVGCKAKKTTGEEQTEKTAPTEYQFDANVLEIKEEYIMVEALEGQTVAGEVQVWTGLLKEKDHFSIKAGDVVRITHDGKMTMSLPPQMSAVEIDVIK